MAVGRFKKTTANTLKYNNMENNIKELNINDDILLIEEGFEAICMATTPLQADIKNIFEDLNDSEKLNDEQQILYDNLNENIGKVAKSLNNIITYLKNNND